MDNRTVNKKDVSKRMAQVILLFILTAAVLFVTAGNLSWVLGWIYIFIYILYIVINGLLLPKELIAERGREN